MALRRTRVKICGITRVEDAQAAAAAGADAIGFVFHPGSPRAINAETARAICAALPAFVTTVGLFVDAEPTAVQTILDVLPLDLLQFHGSETAEYCGRFARPYFKALRMREDIDVIATAQQFATARAILLDTYRADVAGGTGEIFDWRRVPNSLRDKIILAGGLTPDNVANAIAQIHPYAVDVSGGVESAPGRKDVKKIEAFIAAVRRADSALELRSE